MKISNDAQAVVYKKQDVNSLFLVLKRYDPSKNETHYRLIKGGIKVKKGEKAEEAILREINEEAGLRAVQIRSKMYDYAYEHGDDRHEVELFLVENIGNEELRTSSEDEGDFKIEGAEWMPEEDALASLTFETEKDALRNALKIL